MQTGCYRKWDALKERVYVAELKAPSHFYVESEARSVLPNARNFEVSKGYWVARPSNEQSALEGYSELALTILFVSQTLKDAEDHALKTGRMLSELTSAFGGYPNYPPRLNRIAMADDAGKLLSQHNYIYDDQLNRSLGSPFDQIIQHQYQRYLDSFSLTDQETRYRLQLAVHWYGIAVGSDDPMVSYVAAWTGLECIGLIMDSRFHAQDSRTHCPTCGKRRGQKMAGIEHVFKSSILEPEDWISRKDAQTLRNQAVHGRRRSESLLKDCSRFRRVLIDRLNASILTALTPPESNDDQSIRSLMSGDYEFRPCSRDSIKFSNGQTYPYLGEWIEHSLQRKSDRCAGGKSEADPVMNIESRWYIKTSLSEFVESISYEEFKRLRQETYSLPDRKMPPLIPWRERPAETVWRNPH